MFQWKMSAFSLWRHFQLVGCCGQEIQDFICWRDKSRHFLKAWNQTVSCYWTQKTEKIVKNETIEAKFAFDRNSWKPCFFSGFIATQFHWDLNLFSFSKDAFNFVFCVAGENNIQLVKFLLMKHNSLLSWDRHTFVPCCGGRVVIFSVFLRFLDNEVVFSLNRTAGFYWTEESLENCHREFTFNKISWRL